MERSQADPRRLPARAPAFPAWLAVQLRDLLFADTEMRGDLANKGQMD
jgi:hypothetical protein